ncbi:17752_t:CDS:1, partial [Gigaspora rosea]
VVFAEIVEICVSASAQVEILLINVKDQKKKDKRYLNLDENGNQRTIGEKRSEGG